MSRIISTFATCVILHSCLLSQTINVVIKAKLPGILTESSGLEITDRNHIWSHNDSGGDHALYEFDSTGILLRTLHLQNASNHDWEELAQDSAGNIYVGDFGNNNNDRTNLAIYKIAPPSSVTGNSTTPQKINFTYPDQYAFPPSDSLKNFDMEAFFWYRHSLYLFSKNRTNPYTGYTHLYRLPEDAGTYTAVLLDSFYTGPGPYYLTSITSADISPNGKTVALLCGAHIFLFTNFTNDHFLSGNVQQLNFSNLTQKEAIVFINDQEIYLSDEKTDTLGYSGNLYYADLEGYLPTGVLPIPNQVVREKFIIYPNPSSDSNVQLKIDAQLLGADLNIVNSQGQIIFKSVVLESLSCNFPALSPGIYLVNVANSDNLIKQQLVVY